jgi:DNA-binding GntR family transcriptional regulator
VTDARRAGSGGNAEFAYQQIRRAIVEGRYRPGQRLIERNISQEFGLSRTPVRESLRRLEAEGLVLTSLHRGATVHPVTASDVVDVYELRAPLESLAARRAATRANVDDVAELDHVLGAFEEAMMVTTGTPEAVARVDETNAQFHRSLLEIADHQRLRHLLSGAVDLPQVLQTSRGFSSAERVRSNLFHRLIRDAVAAHEPDRAARLMSEHVFMARDTLLAHLRDQREGAD